MSQLLMRRVARVGVALVRAALALLGAALALGGCDEDPVDADDAGTEPAREAVFPADFEDSYREMRDCRNSHEHELHYIRVLVSAEAELPYEALSADEPYPVGATLVKAEYDDELCETRVGYTAYQKLEKGENPAGGDWWWQRLDAEQNVLEQGAPWRCINCHTVHCAPPHGYDLTCAEEI